MKATFNVLTWDVNRDEIKHCDVLPYFRNAYKERLKTSKKKSTQKHLEKYPSDAKYFAAPKSWSELKDFIMSESLYMFWSRCEWEMIIHGWPVQRNDYKIDVHEQVAMNIDIITDLLYKEFFKEDSHDKGTGK